MNEEEKKNRSQYARGVLTGLVIAVFMLVIILFGSEAYKLVTGRSIGNSKSDIVNEEVSDKVKLIESTIHTYFLDDVDETKLADGIYKGVVDSLEDPYSVYYTKEELDSMLETSSGVYYGVGMYLTQDPNTKTITVVKPIKDSPAAEAGILADDVLFAVDGELVGSSDLSEVVAKVKGLSGTKVKMTFYRDGKKMDFEVERREIHSETVAYEMKEDKIGYIQIAEFDDVTYDQFASALLDLQDQGMESLIIDLRGNPGGNLDTVVNIADLILPEGLIVYTEDKEGKRDEYKSDAEHSLSIPLVVLVDGNSASASEILSGAIKDYGVGTLVGTTTFGKGIVQRIIPLGDDTALKLTISKYYTPNGNNIHGIGIEPDVTVEFDSDAYKKDGTDNQLQKALEVIKTKK